MPEKPAQPVPKPTPDKSGASLDATFVERRRFPRPLPLPEVTVGNGGDTEWALWLEHAEQPTPIDIKPDSPDLKKPAKPK